MYGKKFINFPISLCVRIGVFSASVYCKYFSQFIFCQKDNVHFKIYNMTLLNLKK